MAKTRIIVIKLRKMLRIAVPVAIVLVLFLLLLLFFSPSKGDKNSGESVTPNNAAYRAGVYSSVVELNDSLLNLEVVVDENHINSVRLINLDEATAAMYPLMEPAVADISAQLSAGTALEDIALSESSKYTQTLLLDSIRSTLEKAVLSQDAK